VPGKTKVVVIDGVIQYACAFDREKIPGAEDIVFGESDTKREVPAGLLPNLGRAGARNYCLDLTCAGSHPTNSHPNHRFSDKIIGCWRCSMDKNVRWEITSM
jgi:hypothetical protein